MNRANSILHTHYAHQHHIFGKNINVAVLDSGIFPFHKDFFTSTGHSRIKAFIDFTRPGPYRIHSWNEAYDDNGHGTHIAGILGGNGFLSGNIYTGIAPECQLTILKILDQNGNANMEHILRALDWLLARHEDYRIRIVNISVGTTIPKYQLDSCALIKKVEQLWKNGVVVVAAAGNDGPQKGTIGAPGVSRKIITVGSSDYSVPIVMNGKRLTNYSSQGPTLYCIKKPDVVAPGSNIISCSYKTSGSHLPFAASHACYAKKSGTSMSTPMVSGAAALLLSMKPSTTPKQIKLALKTTSKDLGLPHDYQGWGLLDIEAFLRFGTK